MVLQNEIENLKKSHDSDLEKLRRKLFFRRDDDNNDSYTITIDDQLFHNELLETLKAVRFEYERQLEQHRSQLYQEHLTRLNQQLLDKQQFDREQEEKNLEKQEEEHLRTTLSLIIDESVVLKTKNDILKNRIRETKLRLEQKTSCGERILETLDSEIENSEKKLKQLEDDYYEKRLSLHSIQDDILHYSQLLDPKQIVNGVAKLEIEPPTTVFVTNDLIES